MNANRLKRITQKIGNIFNSAVAGANVNGNDVKITAKELNIAADSILKDVNVNQKIKDFVSAVQGQINHFQDDESVKKLENRIKNLEGNKIKFKYDYIILLGIITVFAALFFFLAIWLNRRYCFGISDDGIVIAFAGILATFVVISNYIQTRDVRDNLTKKIAEIEAKITPVDSEKIAQLDDRVYEVTRDVVETMGIINITNGGILSRRGYIKIIPPGGAKFMNVVPDTQSVRRYYERENEILEKEGKPLYKIEEPTDEEITAFHPGFKRMD
jgi:uncharacterized membrane protein (DUF485 family)